MCAVKIFFFNVTKLQFKLPKAAFFPPLQQRQIQSQIRSLQLDLNSV